MHTEGRVQQRRPRALRALYVEIDPALRAFLTAESGETRQSMTAIVEELLRHRYLERHHSQLAKQTLPDLSRAVRAEVAQQLDELDRELKSQVRALERRLGNRLAGMLLKVIRQAYIGRYLTYNLACERYGEDVAASWDQDAAAAVGSYLRAPAPPAPPAAPDDAGHPPGRASRPDGQTRSDAAVPPERP